MNSDMIIQIGTIVIALIGAIVTYIITPYIKQKTSKEQREIILFWVRFAVNGAEQMDQAGIIDTPKKQFVIKYVKDILNKKGITITEEQLDILIEAAVYEINQWK